MRGSSDLTLDSREVRAGKPVLCAARAPLVGDSGTG